MKKIIGILRPFDLMKTFYVYEDGNKIGMFSASVDDLDSVLLAACEEYGVTQVDLTGPKQYVKGIQEKIKQVETTKYNKSEIIINII